MAQLIIDDFEAHGELTDADFPVGYACMAHPDDGAVVVDALPLQFVFHEVPQHKRMLLRASFKVPGGFYPVTFVLDTGLPSALYLVGRTGIENSGAMRRNVTLNKRRSVHVLYATTTAE